MKQHCATCLKDIRSSKPKRCQLCEDPLCNKCGRYDEEVIFLKEWIPKMSNVCDECSSICCDSCLETCLDCWNNHKDSPIVCNNCSKLKIIPCEYHSWSTCGKHKEEEECGECRQNRNYDLRHGYH